MSRKEIEILLEQELQKKKRVYNHTRKELDAVLLEIPSGLPYPDGADRVSFLRRSDSAALQAYMKALREFSDLVVHETVPQRFKEEG